jgi:hypothetical protein
MSRYPSTSAAITSTQARTIEAAFDHAVRLGNCPNYFLTVHWGLTAHADEPFVALQRLLERLRKWLERREVPEIFIWVRERKSGTSEHVHIVVFVPPRLSTELQTAIDRWVTPFDPRAVVLKPA